MRLTLEQMNDLKVFWFARWIAMCYADTFVMERDGELVPSDGKEGNSVLNMEDGQWYAKQFAHFENQVFPLWLESSRERNELQKTLQIINFAFDEYKEEQEMRENDPNYLVEKIKKSEEMERQRSMYDPIEEFVEEYSWLSNFWPVEIQVFGASFPSVEHAYMSQKNLSSEWKEKCQDSRISAAQIKKMSREIDLREDWESVKIDVMYQALCAKFEVPEMKEKLLGTGYAFLMEGNTWNDTFWGVDIKTRKGKNMLGKLLMQVREKIQISEENGNN
jgi:ribA/ribD-fused uncharacterized protein